MHLNLFNTKCFLFHINVASFVLEPLMEQQVEHGFHILKETVGKFLNQSAYMVINLGELFSMMSKQKKVVHNVEIIKQVVDEDDNFQDEEEAEVDFDV